MGNEETAAARTYHQATKHSPLSLRMSTHRLDWPNKPRPFKVYRGLEPIPLPRGIPEPQDHTLRAMATTPSGGTLDLAGLAQALHYAAGVTKEIRLPDGEPFYFRAAACAGALYPVELYVVAGPLKDLPAGVYHFAPKDHALTPLRQGDYRQVLSEAAGEPPLASSGAGIVLTALFWRSAWKYQARAYRYCFWDAGTILANLLAVAGSAGLQPQVVAGFRDGSVDRLLGADGEREGSLCVVPLGEGKPSASPVAEVRPLEAEVEPLSPEEVEYPEIQNLHAASALERVDHVLRWKGGLEEEGPPVHHGRTFLLADPQPSSRPLGKTILARGSTRRFRRAAITTDHLRAILQASTGHLRADFLADGRTLVDLYLILNQVEGLPQGAYAYTPRSQELELLKEGAFRATAGHLCLDQPLATDASAICFFLADLNPVLERFGNRGYRATQLEAGIRGGRMYLAAYGQGLGATGLTFYDDEVVEFFAPHAEGKDAIFVVALGRAGRVGSRVTPVRLGTGTGPKTR